MLAPVFACTTKKVMNEPVDSDAFVNVGEETPSRQACAGRKPYNVFPQNIEEQGRNL